MRQRYLILAVLIALLGLCLSLILLLATPFSVAREEPVAPEPQGAQSLRSWGEQIPDSIRASALDSERVLDEQACDWRPVLTPIFLPAVKDCRSAREATLTLASRLSELTGVHYSRERRHPCMNVREALEEKKVSCTGQSILLVCALRSVGIPARAVGVWSWNHVPGNHTWVEAWFEGQWHMVEANENDFNTPWVMEALGMLNPEHPAQRVLAEQSGGQTLFPTVWNPHSGVAAEDVTEHYLALARQWYASNGVPEGYQKLMVDIQPRSDKAGILLLEDEAGREIARATLPGTQDDMRQFATLMLPRAQKCFLRLEGMSERYPLQANDSAVQILRFRAKGS